MIFLIDYDRQARLLVSMTRYLAEQRNKAEEDRLTLELRLLRENVAREVVLLEAETEVDLRRSHRRYFESLEELIRQPAAA